MGQLKNRFNQEKLESIWTFHFTCLICNKSGCDCFHHIISPSSLNYQDGKFNTSLLNACPVHNFGGCHIGNGKLHQVKTEKKLLKKVLELLVKNNYKFDKIDEEFYQVYNKLYV